MKETSRLKAWMKLAAGVAVCLGLAVGGYMFLTRSFFRIHHVDVRLQDEAAYGFVFPNIKDSLDIRLKNLFGQYVWKVDLEKVLNTVESDQRVKDAKVTRIYPNTIQISILPHTPILNILAGSASTLQPVARNGEVLPKVSPHEASDSPILRGAIFLNDKELRLRAVQLVNELPESGALTQRTVSEISYDKKNGFELRMQNSGLVVWMGHDGFRQRASQAGRVLEYLKSEQLTGRIIDARYGKKVVVKLRNDP